jgi:hypothetical protein
VRRGLPIWLCLTLANLASAGAHAQSRGQLTVTATVTASVGFVLDANHQPHLIIANPADRRDNVSSVVVESRKKSNTGTTRHRVKHKG